MEAGQFPFVIGSAEFDDVRTVGRIQLGIGELLPLTRGATFVDFRLGDPLRHPLWKSLTELEEDGGQMQVVCPFNPLGSATPVSPESVPRQ